MTALLYSALFYLIGTFPTGYLIGKLHGVTIWEHGSKSIGATNVSRILGKKAGVLTLIGDILKGFVPIALASLFDLPVKQLGCLGMFLVFGHCLSLPPYLKGGKGVATALGVFLALSPLLALLSLATFAICIAAWKIVSLASIIAAIALPIYAMLIYSPTHQTLLPWLMAISAMVIFRHRANLKRLIQGEEPRYSVKKS